MHAWQFDHYGHYSENLHWVERPMPTPGFGEALVRTRAVSLNFPDLLIVQGMYQHKAPLPAVQVSPSEKPLSVSPSQSLSRPSHTSSLAAAGIAVQPA